MFVTLIIVTWTPKSCDFLDLFVERRRLTVLPIQAELFSQWSVRMSDLESANIWYSIFWIIMNSSLTVKIGLVRRSDRAANFICCFSYCLNKFRKDIATYLLSYFFFFFAQGRTDLISSTSPVILVWLMKWLKISEQWHSFQLFGCLSPSYVCWNEMLTVAH